MIVFQPGFLVGTPMFSQVLMHVGPMAAHGARWVSGVQEMSANKSQECPMQFQDCLAREGLVA